MNTAHPGVRRRGLATGVDDERMDDEEIAIGNGHVDEAAPAGVAAVKFAERLGSVPTGQAA